MSGGHFEYKQFAIYELVGIVEDLIERNKTSEYPFSELAMIRFREAAGTLRKAGNMLHRIDWLVSGDDSEDTFHRRWDEDACAN